MAITEKVRVVQISANDPQQGMMNAAAMVSQPGQHTPIDNVAQQFGHVVFARPDGSTMVCRVAFDKIGEFQVNAEHDLTIA